LCLNLINLNIIPSLTNGFFLIHPICIILTYCLFWNLLNKKFNIFIKNYFNNIKLLYYSILTKIELSISIIAIFLGGWWANQELGWGGWWSWDSVELINLFLVCYFIKLEHKTKYFKIFSFNNNIVVYFIILVYLHLTVRWDIHNSIHSFLSNNKIEYLNIILIFLWTLYLYKVHRKGINIYNFNYIYWLYITYFILFKFILFKFLPINFEIIILNTIYLIIISNVIWYMTSNIKLWSYSLIFLNTYIYLFLYLFSFFKNKNLIITHIHVLIIVIFILIKFFYNNDFTILINNFNITKIIINFSDLIMLFENNSINSIFLNQNILIIKQFMSNTQIPFYNYLNDIKPMNHTLVLENFSYFNNLNNLFYLFVIFFLKNIMSFYNKYKIWCKQVKIITAF